MILEKIASWRCVDALAVDAVRDRAEPA